MGEAFGRQMGQVCRMARLAEGDKKNRGREGGGESSERKKRTKLVGGCGAFGNWFPRETQRAQSKNKLF